jgi:chromosome partitioning protein
MEAIFRTQVLEIFKIPTSIPFDFISFAALISRASTNPSVSEVAEARSLLADFAHLSLANAVIRDRIAYRKAARDGLSVEELRPGDPKAGEELRALFREVFDGE